MNQSYYPGMLTSDVEFFFQGEKTMVMTEGSIKSFDQISENIKKILLTEISKDDEVEIYISIK